MCMPLRPNRRLVGQSLHIRPFSPHFLVITRQPKWGRSVIRKVVVNGVVDLFRAVPRIHQPFKARLFYDCPTNTPITLRVYDLFRSKLITSSREG